MANSKKECAHAQPNKSEAVKEANRDWVRLASDERILGSSEFVEETLKQPSEVYERRMRMQSVGIDLSRSVSICPRSSPLRAAILASKKKNWPGRLDALRSHVLAPLSALLPRRTCRYPEATWPAGLM